MYEPLTPMHKNGEVMMPHKLQTLNHIDAGLLCRGTSYTSYFMICSISIILTVPMDESETCFGNAWLRQRYIFQCPRFRVFGHSKHLKPFLTLNRGKTRTLLLHGAALVDT